MNEGISRCVIREGQRNKQRTEQPRRQCHDEDKQPQQTHSGCHLLPPICATLGFLLPAADGPGDAALSSTGFIASACLRIDPALNIRSPPVNTTGAPSLFPVPSATPTPAPAPDPLLIAPTTVASLGLATPLVSLSLSLDDRSSSSIRRRASSSP